MTIKSGHQFIQGLELSRRFYKEAVKPILDNGFPSLNYTAALVGHGSEVLGLDTERSMDHNWGPRLQLFLTEQDHARFHAKIKASLGQELPFYFLRYPTNFGAPDKSATRLLEVLERRPVAHGVEVLTPGSFFRQLLGMDPRASMKPLDWLCLPQQELLCLTAGEVFHDGLGELNKLRRKLAYYPRDVWLYLLACQWTRTAQEEAFVGRCGEVGDELGSRLVTASAPRAALAPTSRRDRAPAGTTPPRSSGDRPR